MINSSRNAKSRAERLEIEREMEEQKFAPARKAEAENRELIAAIAAREQKIQIQELRKKLTTEPSPALDFKKFVNTGQTPQEIQKAVLKASDDFFVSIPMNPNDKKVMLKFMTANWSLEWDFTDPEVWAAAYSKLCELLSPEPETQIPTLTQTSIATAPNDEIVLGSRESEARDRSLAFSELIAELRPTLHAAVESLEKTSALVMNEPEQLSLIRAHEKRANVSRLALPFTVQELRKTALLIWGDACGFADAAERDWYELSRDDSSSDDFLATRNIPRVHVYAPSGYTARRVS